MNVVIKSRLLSVATLIMSSQVAASTWTSTQLIACESTQQTSVGTLADESAILKEWRRPARIGSFGAPAEVEIRALAMLGSDQYFVVDSSTTIGLLTANPRKVLKRGNDSQVSIFVDGEEQFGLPSGVRIENIAFDGSDLLFMLDVTAELNGTVYSNHDVIRWNGVDISFAVHASELGLPATSKVIALEQIEGGRLLLGLDSVTELAGTVYPTSAVVEWVQIGSFEANSKVSRLLATLVPCALSAVAAIGPADALFLGGFEDNED